MQPPEPTHQDPRLSHQGERFLPSVRFIAAWSALVGLAAGVAWVGLPGLRAWNSSPSARVARGRILEVHREGTMDRLSVQVEGRRLEFQIERPTGIFAPTAYRPAERVLVRLPEEDQGEASLGPKERERALVVFMAAFLLVLGVAGGPRAVRMALSLVGAFALIVVVLVPLTIRGFDPLAAACGLALVIGAGTVVVVVGANRKSLVAFLGAMGGLALGVVVGMVAVRALALTGLAINFGPHKAIAYRYWLSERVGEVDFSRLLLAGLVVSALGAALDVAITVATSAHEIVVNHPGLPRARVIRAGLAVGRAAVWMTAATLFFVLFAANLEPFLARSLNRSASAMVRLLDFEEIATEVVRLGVAGLAMTAVAPLTALLAGLLLAGRTGEVR